MSEKRSFNLDRRIFCLKCKTKINRANLKDDQLFICPACGQGHFVDIYGGKRCCTTVTEKPHLRRRHPDIETRREAILQIKLAAAEREAETAKAEAREWRAAAEGLAARLEAGSGS